jgi:hypothetical protein
MKGNDKTIIKRNGVDICDDNAEPNNHTKV